MAAAALGSKLSCIHRRKIKHLVTKVYASLLPDWQGAPEKELTLLLACLPTVDNIMSSPIHLGSGIHLFTWILLVLCQQIASFCLRLFLYISAFLLHIYVFVISTLSHIFSSITYKFSSSFTDSSSMRLIQVAPKIYH